MNCFEETIIENQELPQSWREQIVLDELESFLQENWILRSIYYDDGKTESKQQFLSFLSHKAVRTNQYVGTIMFNGEQLNIFPKMYRAEKTDKTASELDQQHLVKNLVRWIEYCNRFFPFIRVTPDLEEEKNLRDLFISLYVSYVSNTLKRGTYYQYIDETGDLMYLKGRFDVCDYYLKKIPNGQANLFRCTYSKFDYDNDINRIIKYTCRLIYPITSTRNQGILNAIFARLNEVSDEKCTPDDCEKIRFNKMHDGKMLESYKTIVSMSKMILLNESTGLNQGTNDTFCFLFPTDILFEGFIGGFVEEVVKTYSGKTYPQKSDMYLIDSFKFNGDTYTRDVAFNMKLDILVEVHDKEYILDTKYKAISKFENSFLEMKKKLVNEIDQGDLYQICEYARKRKVDDVFLLYPMYRYEDKDIEIYQLTGKSSGSSREINVHFIRLPFIFEDDEDRTKKTLKKIFEEILELKRI